MDASGRGNDPPDVVVRPSQPGRRTAAEAALVVLLATFAVGGLLRDGRHQVAFLDLWVFNAIYLLAALLCARPRARGRAMVIAWRLVAVSLSLNLLANLYFSLVTVRSGAPGHQAGPLDDVLQATAYPACYVAVVLAVRGRVPRFLPSMWWDGLVTGLGLAAVVAALPSTPTLGGSGEFWGGFPAAWYPAVDLTLLTLLAAGAATLGASWDRMLVTTGLGLVAVAVGDLVYAVQTTTGTYAEGGLSDAVNLLGVVLLGLGAGARPGTQPRPGDDDLRVGWRVLALPATATVGSVLLLVVLTPEHTVARALAAGSVLAAVVRMFLTLREIRDLEEIHRQARTDDLTGLSNRRAFYEHCDRIVSEATPSAPAALILLDLDGFKQINDSLGHAAGDDLLVQVASRLRGLLPPGVPVARLGGDEFAVLLPDTRTDRALAVAVEIERSLRRTFILEELSIHASTSLGVACAPDAAESRGELLRCADIAMYQAKAKRCGPVPYSAADAAGSLERLRTVEELRQTLDGEVGAGRLVAFLQPQIRPASRRIVGMEALLRWDHPTRGMLDPGAFLSAARTSALMAGITSTMLDLALSACGTWRDRGYLVPVSVNVSAANVHDRALPAKVASALRRHGLPPRALVIELTEDTLMTDPVSARGVLGELQALGVGISIDDYGTGYSSLAYLRQLPVDELKLDRAFIRDLLEDATSAAIVRHTVELAHALGLRLVAEGVEDRATLEAIGRFGCDVAQGYHVARPMPLAKLLRWLTGYGAGAEEPTWSDDVPTARTAPLARRASVPLVRPQRPVYDATPRIP